MAPLPRHPIGEVPLEKFQRGSTFNGGTRRGPRREATLGRVAPTLGSCPLSGGQFGTVINGFRTVGAYCFAVGADAAAVAGEDIFAATAPEETA